MVEVRLDLSTTKLFSSLFIQMKKTAGIVLVSVCAMMLIWCGWNSDSTDGAIVEQPQKEVETMVVENGDTIAVNYIGTSEGELFDTSIAAVAQDYDAANPDAEPVFNEARNYEPLTFEVGAAQMIPWFDAGVVGMQEGETKELTLEPSEAYGEYNEELIQSVPLNNFTDNGLEIVVWESYNFGFTQWTVLEINEDENETIIDFNPRLAWKTLVFEVTIESITKQPEVQPVAEPSQEETES